MTIPKKVAAKFVNAVMVFLLCGGLVLTSVSCDKIKGVSQKILFNRARNLHDQGKLERAIELYQQVIENSADSSDSTEVHYDLGIAYADNHDINNAKKQVAILRKEGRSDLAEVLSTVIRDSDSTRVRKKLQSDYDDQKQK